MLLKVKIDKIFMISYKNVSFSEDGEYCTLLGNRSALWADLKEHRLAISDINLALEAGYPDTLRHKLYERRAKCHLGLRRHREAGDDVNTALKYLECSNLTEEKRALKEKELRKVASLMERELRNAEDPGGEEGGDTKEADTTTGLFTPNPLFPQLSDAVQIKFARNRGRYAVAARDIKIGELVAVEKAFVSFLDKEQRLTNCWHCMACTQAPIPCVHCSGVVFCSTACREAAVTTYHPSECGYTDIMFQANLGAWGLAYRVLTSRPWEYFRQNVEAWLVHDEKAGVGSSEVYSSEDITSFHNLVTHDGVGHKQAPELMMQCHVVVFLVRLLLKVGYISEDQEAEEFQDDAMLAGRLLHHFMRAAYYNTHETTHVLNTKEDFMGNSSVRIGRLTNPSLALLNHSCDPNYRRVSRGTTTYGFACKPINKGAEICDVYCKPFSVGDLEDRQKYLAKYNFQCGCSACGENWPVLECLPGSLDSMEAKRYKQPQSRINSQIQRVNRVMEAHRRLAAKKGVTIDELIPSLVTQLEELHKLLKPPHQLLCYWENVLHQALLEKHASKVSYQGSSNSKVLWPMSQ